MNYHVSSATTQDATELSILVNSAYRGDSSRLGWTTEADYLQGQRTDRDEIIKDIENPRQIILCLRQDSKSSIMGCVLLERFQDFKGIGVYLGMLTVRPDLQSAGMGRYLLGEAEDYARSLGASRIVLGVIQLRESLIDWYERRGYKRTGETQPFPYGDEKKGLPLRPDLYFVMFEKLVD